jgi:hypothetical protein
MLSRRRHERIRPQVAEAHWRPMAVSDLDKITLRVAAVLEQLRFPAVRWQIIAEADHYGADWQTRTELERLPIGNYLDVAAVVSMISASSRPPVRRVPSPGARPAMKPLPEPRTPWPRRANVTVEQLGPTTKTSLQDSGAQFV